MGAAPCAAPAAAGAAETLDQQQPSTSGDFFDIKGPTAFGGPIALAQTFRAGITGSLDRVDLYITQDTTPLTVSIETTTSSGTPSGTVLTGTSISFSSPNGLPAWESIPFPRSADVQAGTDYAIVTQTSGSCFWGWGDGTVGHAGGAAYRGFGEPPLAWTQLSPDLAFKTYVDPAVPQATFLDPLTQSTQDATAVNTAKNGRVVPVEAQLSEGGTVLTGTNAPGPVTLAVTDLGACGAGSSTDPVDAYAAGASSSSGDAFRYDPTSGAWVYNLDTKAMQLTWGDCYRLDVSVNGLQATNAWAIVEPVR